MKLSIKNFAKIKEADIMLNGLTVIAGENNTGKSTIGKILFSLFNSINDINDKIREQRKREMELACRYVLNEFYMQHAPSSQIPTPAIPYSTSRRIIRGLSAILSTEAFTRENISRIVWENLYSPTELKDTPSPEDVEVLNLLTDKIISVANIPDETLLKELISRYFGNVFGTQINSLLDDKTTAEINLEIKSKNLSMFFANNKCNDFHTETWLVHKAIYIDDPFILDNLDSSLSNNLIQSFIKDLLRDAYNRDIMDGLIESVLAQEKLDQISSLLKPIVDGDVVLQKNDEYYFQSEKLTEPLRLCNLSTGLKSFVLIKMLLENNIIRDKDVLILDEPEIHLHPQWQIIYAEIIVLLQKYFDLSIIVTTHSPYFLDAINLFSIKHGVSEKANYYLSSIEDEGATIELVTSDINKIYQKMASPIQALETLRYELNNPQ